MSTVTNIGITCSRSDMHNLLEYSTRYGLGLKKKSVGIEHFNLFSVRLMNADENTILQYIYKFEHFNWMRPDACSMTVEDSSRPNLCKVVLPIS